MCGGNAMFSRSINVLFALNGKRLNREYRRHGCTVETKIKETAVMLGRIFTCFVKEIMVAARAGRSGHESTLVDGDEY
jgi:hypothetical protein